MDINKNLKRAIIITYVILCIVVSVFGIFSKQNGNSFEKGYLFFLPTRNQTVSSEFTISGSVYAKECIDTAYLDIKSDNYFRRYPIEFDKITYEDKLLETLSTFSINASLDDGSYTANVIAVTTYGTELQFNNYPIVVDKNSSLQPFEMFGTLHLVTMAILTLIGIFLFTYFKNKPVPQIIIRYILIFTMFISDVYIRLWLINNSIFKASYDMTLHMCDIGAIILVGMMLTENKKLKQNLYNMLFIWGIGGAFMAILTPEMRGFGFPSFYYFNFFIKHSAIIYGVLFVTFFDGLRPRLKSLPRVIGISTILVAFIYGLNQLIRFIPPYEVGNYMFVSYPPLGGSAIDLLVDIFGPSPWYYLGMIMLGAIVFLVLYIPFYIEEIIKRKKKTK